MNKLIKTLIVIFVAFLALNVNNISAQDKNTDSVSPLLNTVTTQQVSVEIEKAVAVTNTVYTEVIKPIKIKQYTNKKKSVVYRDFTYLPEKQQLNNTNIAKVGTDKKTNTNAIVKNNPVKTETKTGIVNSTEKISNSTGTLSLKNKSPSTLSILGTKIIPNNNPVETIITDKFADLSQNTKIGSWPIINSGNKFMDSIKQIHGTKADDSDSTQDSYGDDPLPKINFQTFMEFHEFLLKNINNKMELSPEFMMRMNSRLKDLSPTSSLDLFGFVRIKGATNTVKGIGKGGIGVGLNMSLFQQTLRLKLAPMVVLNTTDNPYGLGFEFSAVLPKHGELLAHLEMNKGQKAFIEAKNLWELGKVLPSGKIGGVYRQDDNMNSAGVTVEYSIFQRPPTKKPAYYDKYNPRAGYEDIFRATATYYTGNIGDNTGAGKGFNLGVIWYFNK